MASTLHLASGGRLVLGIGIGGAKKEHDAYGIEFPEAPERVARLEEAVAVIRALWTGGPITRESPFYPLHEAYAHPVAPKPPRIIVGGETRPGARLAARIGDGWSTFDDNFEANLPVYLETLEAEGRRRDEQQVLVGFQGDWLGEQSVADTPWVIEPRDAWARWRAAGGCRRALVSRRVGRSSPPFVAPSRRDHAKHHRAGPSGARGEARPDAFVPAMRGAGPDRRRAVREMQPARAA